MSTFWPSVAESEIESLEADRERGVPVTFELPTFAQIPRHVGSFPMATGVGPTPTSCPGVEATLLVCHRECRKIPLPWE